ncbi:Gfo/Idh/MocA family protein [Streptacidiphilus sp. EB103A]|uniref:Gfo/Idh/MocA family protein n=1 Tax=Streptacidiphilus sp. EB103A TaxID=3156275 RepID=UPI0035152FBF
MPVRIGVIGVGVMGAEHARLLSRVVSGSEVTAVADFDAEQARTVAKAYGARVFDDPLQLIADDRVDAVLIASSDPTHEQFVLACLAAGKPVLCEKPLAADLDGCLRILDAEQEAGRRLVTVGFMRRYDPGYLDIKATVDGGDIGRPLAMHCVHRNAGPGGTPTAMLITGSAVHEIDIARWLLRDEIDTVTVHRPRASARSGGTQDPLFLVFSSAEGVLIDVEVFVTAGYGYEVRCELVAEAGTVLLDSPAPTVRRSAGRRSRDVPADWRPRFAEAYRRELQDWVDGVATGDPVRGASAWDGYAATAVAAAGVRALDSGLPQTVSLLDRPELYR